MAYTLKMPEVGETVTEGTIEKWLKQPGDKIEKYEPIVEINTDKVNVELPSPVNGTMTEILAQEGETVLVGAALATIEEVAGEMPADTAPPKPTEASPAAAEPQPAAAEAAPAAAELQPAAEAAPAAAEPQSAAAEPAPAQPKAAAKQPQPAVAQANGQDSAGGPHRATPRVRKVAAELGVDLAQVQGSGPRGRVVEEDVRAYAAKGPKAAPAAGTAVAEKPAAPRPAATPGADEEAIPLTGIRRTIAQRMTASAAAPVAWLVIEADVSELVKLRSAKREAFRERHGVDLTYLPFAAHTVVQALLDHPYLNASWGEDKIVLKKRVHLGIAVASERGLIVPVVRDADRLSVSGLSLAMSELGEKVRANKLQLDDVQGGTFTLDNTGAFGSIVSMPIVNLGQAAIISLETIQKRPAVVGGDAIGVRSLVNMCLSFDHRILDGHQAGAFLQDVKKRMEAFGPETGID
ncbi:MAG: 2-oxo acid dehydrogenase subunit E2 [Chloroflexota bacterium]|nr:2-oxo acid dehydrogenase subunit E2 [Chloroflexota bacterium]